MKIKKVFSFLTVASLAVLMTACGKKTTKNESIIDNELLDLFSISADEAFETSKSNTTIGKVFEGKSMRDSRDGIFLTYDNDNYYVYNIALEKGSELILTVAKTDIYNISINKGAVLIQYNANEQGYRSYEIYLFDGTKILDKTTVSFFGVNEKGTSNVGSFLNLVEVTKYEINYNVVEENGSTTTKGLRYCNVKKNVSEDIYESKYVYEYLTEEDYIAKYGNETSVTIDGEIVGLDGYTFKIIGEKLFVMKKDKVVNVLSASVINGIVNNKYLLFQTAKSVTKADDYDFYFKESGQYLKIETFKMCLLDSKITKLDDFHYYLISNAGEPLVEKTKNGYRIESALTAAIDFKDKKEASLTDIRIASIKGNGDIQVHTAMNYMEDTIKINDTYYAFVGEQTYEIDKKGNIKKAYDGFYYNGVSVVRNSNTQVYSFSKNGKQEFILKNGKKLGFAKYMGEDIYKKKVIVEVTKDGDIAITNIDGYTYDENIKLFYKVEDGKRTYYTLDSSLTAFETTFDSTVTISQYTDFNGEMYYRYTTDGDKYSLIYFD